MSCYFRHLKDIFEEAGITVTPANRQDLDAAIHKIVGVAYKDCPGAWKALKARFLTDDRSRRDLVKRLKAAGAGRRASPGK
jgi:hypothetical protein